MELELVKKWLEDAKHDYDVAVKSGDKGLRQYFNGKISAFEEVVYLLGEDGEE